MSLPLYMYVYYSPLQQYSSSGIGSIPTTCEDSLSCCSMSLSPLSDFCSSPTPSVGGDDMGVVKEEVVNEGGSLETPSSNSHICDLIKVGVVTVLVGVVTVLTTKLNRYIIVVCHFIA